MTRTPYPSRRRFLKLSRATAAALTIGVGTTAADTGGWTVAETPTGNTLYDAERTVDGLYAVGAGGIVLCRTAAGWEKVLDGGPTGNGNSLYGADVTDDGSTLWFVGASGAIGEYDIVSGVLDDHSAPMDVTNNFNDVSVRTTENGTEVYVAGDSGKIYYSFDGGRSGTWDYTTPGSGSAVNAIDFFGGRKGHAVDGNKTVFETDDGGSYGKIGVADANNDFYGVDSDGFDDVTVVGGGTVLEWDGARWTRTDLGDAQLRDVEAAGVSYTVGGGVAVFRRDAGRWTQEATSTGANLKAVVDGPTPLAVGAGGTVIARK
jgi:photosystem II stability/assembly factor-like uncharacterized protein